MQNLHVSKMHTSKQTPFCPHNTSGLCTHNTCISPSEHDCNYVSIYSLFSLNSVSMQKQKFNFIFFTVFIHSAHWSCCIKTNALMSR